MYYPYFRGKQFDLITIREQAKLISKSGFTPIIEPVKEAINGLKRTLEYLRDEQGSVVVIVNPAHGFYKGDNTKAIDDVLRNNFSDYQGLIIGILLVEDTDLADIQEIMLEHDGRPIAFIHAGFSAPKKILEILTSIDATITHIFLDQYCGKLYRKHFVSTKRVLVKDGFKKEPLTSFIRILSHSLIYILHIVKRLLMVLETS